MFRKKLKNKVDLRDINLNFSKGRNTFDFFLKRCKTDANGYHIAISHVRLSCRLLIINFSQID